MRILKGIAKFALILGFQVLLVYLLLITAFDGMFSDQNINDATFVVGAVMLSIGLITFTNAGRIFTGFRFAFKQITSRHNYTHLAYYDYKRSIENKTERVTGVYPLLGGLLFVTISTIIGFMYFT